LGPPRPPLASVEQVRADLRRLGYLDSGLDRFVLGGAEPASMFRTCLTTAARVGLVGGPLAGTALLLAAVGLDRRLLAEPRDLVVLALYLWLVLTLAVSAIAFAAGLLAGWTGRRGGRAPRPRLARDLGLGAGLLGAAYVVFWWRSHAFEAHPLAQGVALLLGLGMSLALGRFCALAVVAVLSAAGAAGELPQASLTRRHLVPLLALGALALAVTVGAASYWRDRSPATPDFAVVPSGLRVRVLGIDGLEARLTAQLIERGELPHLQALQARGAHGRLRAEPEQVPAIVWTTIATGRGPEAHGIQSAGVRRLAGMRTPVAGGSRLWAALGAATDLLRLTRTQPPSALLRSVKAFWNVASEKGLRVGVVNWWATWPADDAVNGYVVSDRAFFKLDKGGPFEREAHPAEVFERLRALLPPAALERALRLDRFHVAAAAALRGTQPPDLEAVYLQGLDLVTMQQLDAAAVADIATLDTHLATVRAYYRRVDEFVGDLTRELGPRDVLVLVGDPGRLPRSSATAADGLLLVVGGPAVVADLGSVSERDIAPTVLHLVGLPVSRELTGQVLEAALAADFRTQHPVRYVPSFGPRARGRARESRFDEQMLEELRSLGYVQ
jgi:Type I phosphodiesterase / nucleotide pyrophosphatase